eukprot:5495607-Alexandrium_andersonii.AAC.1
MPGADLVSGPGRRGVAPRRGLGDDEAVVTTLHGREVLGVGRGLCLEGPDRAGLGLPGAPRYGDVGEPGLGRNGLR